MCTKNNLSNDQGVVYKKVSGSYWVQAGDREIACTLSSHLIPAGPGATKHSSRRGQAPAHTDPIAVGDIVRFSLEREDSGSIIEVMPRRNQFARRSAVPMPGAHAFEQVIAANVDQIVPVFAAASPEPHWNMLDRYLVTAESFGIPVLVCVTKLDLVQDSEKRLDEEIAEAVAEYRRIGYPMVLVSALTGEGLSDLRLALHQRMSVFLGKSGVGKTSLLNALQPGLGLRINEVNQITGRGKHTTTHLEMFNLDFGGAIVDTPGVREFGLWDIHEDDLALFFPEIRPYHGRCKFGLGCRHIEEPGCAVRKAVSAGQISPRRYFSYLKLKANP